MNHVIQNHDSDLIWLLDNDVVVETKTLSELVRVVKSDERIGAAGSMMCKLDNQVRINELGGYMDWRKFNILLNAHNLHIASAPRNVQQVDFCAATSLLTKREVIDRIGFLEDLFIHFDDVEWCLRMNASGWKVVASPKSKIWHELKDVKTTRWVRYYDVRNLLRVHAKYRPRLLKKAVKHFKRHGRYFRLHDFKKTAMMIRASMRDFKRGKIGKRDFVQETAVSLSDRPDDVKKNGNILFFLISALCAVR